jgi:hypothetical protein
MSFSLGFLSPSLQAALPWRDHGQSEMNLNGLIERNSFSFKVKRYKQVLATA